MAAHWTWTSPSSELLVSVELDSLVAEALAVLVMSAAGGPTIWQSAAVVAAVRVMVLLPPEATLPKLQVSVLRPACGLVPAQAAASVPPTVQLRVAGPGRTSVSVTALAVPGPRLDVTIVNTALLPAVTLPAPGGSLSGGFTTRTCRHWAVTVSL